MKKIFIIFLSSILAFWACSENKNYNNKKNAPIYLSGIKTSADYYHILEHWKNPGKYISMNAFDGNLKTCFAKRESTLFDKGGISSLFNISFEKYVKIDTIKIAAGCFLNEKYYKMNNRLKGIKILFFREPDETGGSSLIIDESFELKDNMRYQVMKLKKAYNTYWIMFDVTSIYKGSQYNDTCVSDVKFYYRGRELKLEDIVRAKKEAVKNYIQGLRNSLTNMLKGKTLYYYGVNFGKPAKLCFRSDGILKIYSDYSDKRLDYFKKIKKWKIKAGKLFFLVGNKWQLVKYDSDELDFEILKIGSKDMTDNRNKSFFIGPKEEAI